jgi:hypothetical protein
MHLSPSQLPYQASTSKGVLSANEESAEALVHDLPTAIRVDVKGRYRVVEVAGVGKVISVTGGYASSRPEVVSVSDDLKLQNY